MNYILMDVVPGLIGLVCFVVAMTLLERINLQGINKRWMNLVHALFFIMFVSWIWMFTT